MAVNLLKKHTPAARVTLDWFPEIYPKQDFFYFNRSKFLLKESAPRLDLSSQFDCLADRLDLKSLVLVGVLCLLMRLGSDRVEN
jgi:hypothetical protein